MWYSNTTTSATTYTAWNWEPQRTWTTSTTSTSNWDKYQRAEILQDWIKNKEKKKKFVESEINENEILNLIKDDI